MYLFPPVVRYNTLFKRHLDCPKAFTQADLNTPCYLMAPTGMEIPIGWCIELLKSIYGLKQTSRLFHQLLWL
jgi:hypothetical protein